MEKEVRVLVGGPRQYHLTIPRTIVQRLFRKGTDGRYYVRIHVEGNELIVSPLTAHSEMRGLNPLRRLEQLHQQEGEDSASGT